MVISTEAGLGDPKTRCRNHWATSQNHVFVLTGLFASFPHSQAEGNGSEEFHLRNINTHVTAVASYVIASWLQQHRNLITPSEAAWASNTEAWFAVEQTLGERILHPSSSLKSLTLLAGSPVSHDGHCSCMEIRFDLWLIWPWLITKSFRLSAIGKQRSFHETLLEKWGVFQRLESVSPLILVSSSHVTRAEQGWEPHHFSAQKRIWESDGY